MYFRAALVNMSIEFGLNCLHDNLKSLPYNYVLEDNLDIHRTYGNLTGKQKGSCKYSKHHFKLIALTVMALIL